jgi:O-antigen/teichoic acid export membrane protein
MLGPSDFGVITISIAFVSLFVTLMLIGVERGVIRYVAFFQAHDENTNVFESILASLLMVGTLCIVMSTTLWYWIVPLSHFIAIDKFAKIGSVIPFIIIPMAFSILCQEIFTGMKKMRYVMILSGLEKTILLMLITALLVGDRLSIISVMIAYGAAPILGIVIGLIIIIKTTSTRSVTWNGILKKMKTLLSFSWRLSIGDIANTIRIQGELLLLGYFLPSGIVGGYSAASLIAGILLLPVHSSEKIVMAISTSLFVENRIPEIRTLYQLISRWLFLFACLAFGAIALNPQGILGIFYGTVYNEYALLLLVLIIPAVLSLTSATQSGLNHAFGMTSVILASGVIGAVSNIIIALWLIPYIGGEGAAIARIVGVLFCEGIGVVAIYRYYRIQPLQKIHLHILSVASGVWIVSYVLTEKLQIHWSIAIGLFVSITVTLLWVLRIIPRDDLSPALLWYRQRFIR